MGPAWGAKGRQPHRVPLLEHHRALGRACALLLGQVPGQLNAPPGPGEKGGKGEKGAPGQDRLHFRPRYVSGGIPVRFLFNEKKTAQAAAFLLRRHGGTLEYLTLIKLLYLADRKALVDRGMPITGDRMVSMDKGPVLSLVLDRITWGPQGNKTPWFEYISAPQAYRVSVVSREAPVDELSRYELEVLEQIDDQFGKMNRWDLVRLTHDLPEWEDPRGSSLPIDPTKVLRESAVSEEQIRAINEEAEEAWSFRRSLTSG